jgi:hypothetical protein
MEQTIQELWALPINMKELPYDFHGYKLFTSDKLKLKFFEAILATSWGKYHAKNVNRLLKTGNIVPVIMNKGIISFLAKKFFSMDWSKEVQGLYSGELNKVLVFIDNNSNWMGVSSNKNIVKTTLHECMHLSANSNMNGFMKIMKPTFQTYYSSYYADIFSCENVNADKIVKTMVKLEGIFNSTLQSKLIKEIMDATSKSKLDKEEYENILKDLFTITRNFPLNPNLIMRYYSKYYHIFGPLNTAYMKTFKERNSYTSPVQELWALSEVAAVMVELLPVDPRVAKVLSNIK